MNHRLSLREIASGSVITLVGLALNFGLQTGTFIAVSRFWGQAGLGLFSAGWAFLWIVGNLFRLGLANGTLRYVAVLGGRGEGGAVRRLLREVSLVTAASSLLGGLVLLAVSSWLGALFSKPGLVPILHVLAFGLVFWNLVFIGTFAIQGLRRMGWLVAARNVFQPGLGMLAVATAGVLGLGLVGGISAYVLSLVPSLLFCAYVLNRLLGHARPASEPPRLREVVLFSLPLIWTQLLAYGIRQQEVLVASYFLPAAQVGLYSASLKSAVMVGFVLQATSGIFTPVAAHLHGSGDLELLRRLYRTVSRWCLTLALPLFLACVLFGRQILTLYGPGFAQAWVVLVILAGAQLVDVSTGSAGALLIMGEKQKIELMNTVLAFCLGLALDIVLIPHLGILGAALGAAASRTTVNLLRVWQTWRFWRANPFGIGYLKPLAVGAAAALAVRTLLLWLQPSYGFPWNALLGLILMAALYAGGLWAVGLDADDRDALRSLRNRAPGRRAAREAEALAEARLEPTASGLEPRA